MYLLEIIMHGNLHEVSHCSRSLAYGIGIRENCLLSRMRWFFKNETNVSHTARELHLEGPKGILSVKSLTGTTSIEAENVDVILESADLLLARHIHCDNGHIGQEHTLNLLRERFWICNARSLVRKIINKCFVCRKGHAPQLHQQMAPLPKCRVTSYDSLSPTYELICSAPC